MAKDHSSAVMVLSHFEIAWFRIDRAVAHNVLFNLSTNPFCHCAFTPLKFSRCFLFLMSFWNVSLWNAPLSACYDSTFTF
jgi:hypothetical protein